MRTVANELFYVISLTIASFVVSKFIWLLPVILFLPIVLTYTVDTPLIYLVILGIIAEVFTFLPPGIMFATIFLPWIIFRVFGRLQVDMSLLFGSAIVLTLLLQIALIYSYDVYVARDIMAAPWLRIIPVILFTSTISFLTSVAIYFNRPV